MSQSLTNHKVLITGGAGFIGSNLVEKFLNQSNYVVCLDNLSTGFRHNIQPFLKNKNFLFIEGDICNLEVCKNAVESADIVFHQAALGSVPRSINDPIATNNANITGFLNMLVATRDAGIKRFIYAASSSTYGDHPGLPKLEDKIGKPLSPYAVTKYVNELYANVFSDLYGIETIGLRYFNVFGRRQDPNGAYAAVIPKFIKALIRHEHPEIYGDGTQSRDFTYIDNVLQINELAALAKNHDAINRVYNVAFGEKTSLNELYNILKNLLSNYDAKIGNIQVKYGNVRKGDIKHSLASIDAAKHFLNYKPEFNIKKGLEKAIDWYWQNLQ